MTDADQQGFELLASPFVASRGQRTKGIAVVTLPTGDQVLALWLANLDEILTGQFQGRFHGFGTTRDEVHRLNPFRGPSNEKIRQLLHHLRGEERSVCIG
ncbi:hypothetical protein D3C81_1837040 [compost metagenome]